MNDVAADLDEVLGLLIRLASGDYTARGIPSRTQEDFAALMLGVNMLAEELEASRTELEAKVTSRTALLQQLNRDVAALSDLTNQLQKCETTHEAIEVTARGVSVIFSRFSGALYVRADVPNTFVQVTAWGPHAPAETALDSSGCEVLQDDLANATDAAALMIGRHELGATGAEGVSSLRVPLIANDQLFGTLLLVYIDPAVPADPTEAGGLVRMATAAAEFAALALANLELREQLWSQAMRDPLTDLYNRRFMQEWAAGELSRTDRAVQSLGVILVDLDGFKQVNDEHGHEAGDRVLQAVASLLRSAQRPADLACRYGGEEFALLVSLIDRDTLVARADDIRCRVEMARGNHAGATLPPVTVSIGVALYPDHGDCLEGVLAAADEALYRAKQAGRNRVESAAP